MGASELQGLMITDAIRHVAVPQIYSESSEAGLLGGGYEAEAARCCPIALQETRQISQII